ncbi:MAG: FKBP-type peptidyl-prolyl cis-trans isomerase, partial [Chitinophagales bacterium]
NNLTAQKTSSGLHYIINNAGTGTQATSSDNVTVVYKGYFTNGSVFDESDASGISFNLQNVIKGWTEGIPLFKEGGNGVLLIPSSLAYGNSGKGSVPGGAVLVFDVKLISVN